MALSQHRTEVLEPEEEGKYQSKSVYRALILGDGHLEGEKDHGFILLISLVSCMVKIFIIKKFITVSLLETQGILLFRTAEQ